MAIDDNTSYELTGAQVKDLANKIKAKADDNIFVGATSAAPGSKGLVPAPQAGDDAKFLSGDGTWKTAGGGGSSTLTYTLSTMTPGSYQNGVLTYNGTRVTGSDVLSAYNAGNRIVISYNGFPSQYFDVIEVEDDREDIVTVTFVDSSVIPNSTVYQIDMWYTAVAADTLSASSLTYSDFTGATSSVAGAHGLVPAPSAGDQGKVLHGDGTWKDTTAKLVEMSYGESNAWAKFIAAYNAGSIVYCRASSNANPGTGSQTRKAFMAYVNNATNPTNVEFQYVRSQSSKTDSQQTDQVFVYTLTNASGGTWSVASRNMGPKINVNGPITKTFTSGANATITIGADAMTGATASTAGAAGVVPKPVAGDNTKFLRGDGTWQTAGGGTAYSTSEVATNDTWLNGETIYRKTITSSGLDGVVAHGITNLDKVIKVEAVFNNNDHQTGLLDDARVLPSSMYADGMWEFVVTSTDIELTYHGTYNTGLPSFHVTLYYTKGTPRPEPEPEPEEE